jgi:hypothetical protein
MVKAHSKEGRIGDEEVQSRHEKEKEQYLWNLSID